MNQFDALFVALVLYGAIAWERWGSRLLEATKRDKTGNKESLLDPAGIHPDQCTMDIRKTGDTSRNTYALNRRKGFARNAGPDTEASEQAGASSSTVRTTTTLSRTAGLRT